MSTGFKPIHLNDVASALENCADVFGQLAALLKAIQEKSAEHSDAARLAALGRVVAEDMENFASSTLEQLQKGGVRDHFGEQKEGQKDLRTDIKKVGQ